MKQLKWLCALVLMALCLLGFACAEEATVTLPLEVELFCEGDLPVVGMTPRTYAASAAEDYLYEQLMGSAKSIDLKSYQMTYAELNAMLNDLLNRRPELFHVGKGSRVDLSGSNIDTAKVLRIRPAYKYTGAVLQEKRAIYNAGVQAIVDYARTAQSDVAKVLRINDYICAHYAYDDVYFLLNSPEEMFEYGMGMCQAYMLAFCAALNELDIPNLPVTSRAMNHIWNLVCLDGDWYHVDPTWNDPLDSCALRANHNNFLFSDEGFLANGHFEWSAAEKALNTQYDDMFWQKMYQAAPIVDNVIYYLDVTEDAKHPTIRSYDLDSGAYDEWFSFDAPGYSDHNVHAIWATRNRFFYAVDHKVYAVPRAGGTPEIVCELGSDEHVWAVFLEGDMLHLFAAQTPYADGSIYQMLLSEAHVILLTPSRLDLTVGETAQIAAEVIPDVHDGAEHIHWLSSDPAVVSVDDAGNVTAHAVGAVILTADFDGIVYENAVAVVHGSRVLRLPAQLAAIEAEAFRGMQAEEIVLKEGVAHIGAKAFADCPDLKLINLPASVVTIADNAFENVSGVTMLCASETGRAYAEGHGFICVMENE